MNDLQARGFARRHGWAWLKGMVMKNESENCPKCDRPLWRSRSGCKCVSCGCRVELDAPVSGIVQQTIKHRPPTPAGPSHVVTDSRLRWVPNDVLSSLCDSTLSPQKRAVLLRQRILSVEAATWSTGQVRSEGGHTQMKLRSRSRRRPRRRISRRPRQLRSISHPNGACPHCHVGPTLQTAWGKSCLHCGRRLLSAQQIAEQLAAVMAAQEAARARKRHAMGFWVCTATAVQPRRKDQSLPPDTSERRSREPKVNESVAVTDGFSGYFTPCDSAAFSANSGKRSRTCAFWAENPLDVRLMR